MVAGPEACRSNICGRPAKRVISPRALAGPKECLSIGSARAPPQLTHLVVLIAQQHLSRLQGGPEVVREQAESPGDSMFEGADEHPDHR